MTACTATVHKASRGEETDEEHQKAEYAKEVRLLGCLRIVYKESTIQCQSHNRPDFGHNASACILSHVSYSYISRHIKHNMHINNRSQSQAWLHPEQTVPTPARHRPVIGTTTRTHPNLSSNEMDVPARVTAGGNGYVATSSGSSSGHHSSTSASKSPETMAVWDRMSTHSPN
jgi:hypothetical protein